MLSKLITYVSIAALTVISLSFGLFMIDEAQLSSKRDQIKLEAGGAPAAPLVARDEHGRQLGRGQMRMRIDSAADRLTGPFETVAGSKDAWVMRFSAFMLGIVFWGLILLWLARSLRLWSNGSSARPARATTT